MNIKNTTNLYTKRINKILKKIINNTDFKNSKLLQAMKYSILSRGKRIRPLLVYFTGTMLNTKLLDLDIPASAIECIHTYSLIHDDLPAMDNDNFRRGKLTCHKKYGQDIAILAGNALQALSFKILSSTKMSKINLNKRLLMISTLAHYGGISGICGGQSFDIYSNKKINLKILNNIHLYKTASLIRASVRLGVLTSNTKFYKYLPILDIYAKYLGLAFQIKNDILDVTGNIKNTGKKQNSDKKLKKNTYPVLIGLKNSKFKVLHFYKKAIDILDNVNSKVINTKILKNLANFILNINS